MEKWMCLGTLGISGVMLLLFLLDAILGIPFSGLSLTVDVIAIIAAGLIGYASWQTYQEFK